MGVKTSSRILLTQNIELKLGNMDNFNMTCYSQPNIRTNISTRHVLAITGQAKMCRFVRVCMYRCVCVDVGV